MTGRYLIHTPVDSVPNEKRFDAAWRRFVAVCRSLHQDGLSYTVELRLAGAMPHILIVASGKAKPRQVAKARPRVLPMPIPPQTCRERGLEAAWFLPENAERRNANTSHWRTRHSRYAELSAMAEEQLRAELAYWQELELLSGQRQHFKPGLTPETAYMDDEVAA